MDEQENTVEDELDLATDTDEVADTEATDTSNEDEQEQDTLDLDDSEVESQEKSEKGKAELAKEKLVNDWVKNVKSGKKSLDDIPDDQSWLKPLVEAKSGKVEFDDSELDRKLDERERTKKFKSLAEDLKSMDLDAEQKSTLETKFKTLRAKGLSQLDALELAMEVAGVDPEQMALDAKLYAARLRVPGSYKKGEAEPEAVESTEGFAAVAKRVSPDKAWEYLKKQL